MPRTALFCSRPTKLVVMTPVHLDTKSINWFLRLLRMGLCPCAFMNELIMLMGCSTREIGKTTAQPDLLVCRPRKQRKRLGPGLYTTHKHDLVQTRQHPALKEITHGIQSTVTRKNAKTASRQAGLTGQARNHQPTNKRTN